MPVADVEKIIRREPLEELYDVGSELGRGKFAIVKRCTEKCTGHNFAVKVLKKRRRGKSCRDEILVEIDVMRQSMDHQRIVKLHEVFESSSEFHIIIELATGGELFRVIAIDPLPEEKAREVVFQIVDGVSHLHNLNVVHLDLKPENILLYRKGSLDVKIADFGLAVQLKEGEKVRTLVGTAEYVAPEILSYDPLSTFSDMWSIGALTYALLTGYSPFQGETHQETFLNVSTCDYDFEDEVFDVVSPEAKEFIEKLLIRHPTKRMTAEKCLQHAWMVARGKTNLNSSTSSLDSALCLDSASSMEPSPVSSASSSFSPAPSATSKSVTTTSTTTITTSGNSQTYSQPADIGKVNEKLSQISTLATDRLVAETSSRVPPEDSPASTDSSTSTLKGDESSVFILCDSAKLETEASKKGSVTESVDGRQSGSTTRVKVNDEPMRYTERARTLERTSRLHNDSSSLLERRGRRSERGNSPDLTTLDPKTLESLDKYNRKLKDSRHRVKTPEPLSPDVSTAKLLLSPERHMRRKSEGMVTIGRRVNTKDFKGSEPTVTEEEESRAKEKEREDKEKERQKELYSFRSISEDSRQPKAKEISPELRRRGSTPDASPGMQRRERRVSETSVSISPKAKRRESPFSISPEAKRRESPFSISPEAKRRGSPFSISPEARRREVVTPEARQKDVVTPEARRREVVTPETRRREVVTPEARQKDVVTPEARRREVVTPEARRREVITPEARRREVVTPEARMGESPSVVSPETRRRERTEAWRTTERRDEVVSETNTKLPLENGKKEPLVTEANQPHRLSDKRESPRPEVGRQLAEQRRSPGRLESPKPEGGVSRARSQSPKLGEVKLRQRSPIPEHLKQAYITRRRTPVISMDAMDAILRGEIPEDELEELEGSKSRPSFQKQNKVLESFPEEDEQVSPKHTRVSSPTGTGIIVLKSSVSPDRSRSPEKRVTINSQPSLLEEKQDIPVLTHSCGVERASSPEKRNRKTDLLSMSAKYYSTTDFTPERESRDQDSPSPDRNRLFSNSIDSRSSLLRAQSLAFSHSTPDLTDLMASIPKKETKRVERSSSRRSRIRDRLGGGDSYVTNTSSHSARHTSGHYRGGRNTLPSKLLSGRSIGSRFSFSRSKEDKSTKKSSCPETSWC